MEVAMHCGGNIVEGFSAIVAQQQHEVGFENLIFICRINGQVGEIKRAPNHVDAAVEFGPGCASVVRAIEAAAFFGLDVAINDVRFGFGYCQCEPPVWFWWQTFGVVVSDFAPVSAAVGRSEQSAAGTTRAECPALAAEVPHGGINSF